MSSVLIWILLMACFQGPDSFYSECNKCFQMFLFPDNESWNGNYIEIFVNDGESSIGQFTYIDSYEWGLVLNRDDNYYGWNDIRFCSSSFEVVYEKNEEAEVDLEIDVVIKEVESSFSTTEIFSEIGINSSGTIFEGECVE